jgi:hypothetical protein
VFLPHTSEIDKLLRSLGFLEWMDPEALSFIVILAVGPGGQIPSTFKLNQGIVHDPDAPDAKKQFDQMSEWGLVKTLVSVESRPLIIEASMRAKRECYKSEEQWKKRKRVKRTGAKVMGCYPPWPLQMWTNGKNCENKGSPFSTMQTAAAGGECPLSQETHFIMIQETKKKDKACWLNHRPIGSADIDR